MKEEIYYKYNSNKRTYVDPETGIKSSGPIRKYSYDIFKAVDTTSRSVIMIPSYMKYDKDSNNCKHLIEKVPLKDSLKKHGFLTKEQMEQDIWMAENQYKLCEFIRSLRDFDIIKEIAKIAEYKEKI